MRVLAVTHSLGSNGAAICLHQVLVAIKASGGSVDVLYDGNEWFAQSLRDLGIRILSSAQTADYDVALVNTIADYAKVAQLAVALPVVFWVHEGVTALNDKLAMTHWHRAFSESSRLIFQTPWQSQIVFSSFLHEVEHHRIVHIPPCAYLQPQSKNSRPFDNRGDNRIISVGSIYPRKRPQDLALAVARMEIANVHCTMVGSLEWAQHNDPCLQDSLAQWPARFTLQGEAFDEDLARQFRNADVFCSTSGDETFGTAQLEAAAFGLPLALSDLPCYEGIWRHGVNALLAPVGAVDCIAWNLTALCRDEKLAQRIALEGQKTAARFTREKFLRSMSEVLVQAILDPVTVSARSA